MRHGVLVVGTASAAFGLGYALGRSRRGKSEAEKSSQTDSNAKCKRSGIRPGAANGDIASFAGSSETGFLDGEGIAARFNYPNAIVSDGVGNLFLCDHRNHAIRKVTPSGTVTTLAGNGEQGCVDGTGPDARLNGPIGICIDGFSRLYICDSGSHSIRKITLSGSVKTVAGYSEPGFLDGKGSFARFNCPLDIANDEDGNLFVCDALNHAIRKITPEGDVVTLAGNGEAGFVDGDGGIAQFDFPCGIALDSDGNLLVSEFNHAIRKVTPFGKVTTLAGNGEPGFLDGAGERARFNHPRGIGIDGEDNLLVADYENNAIRKVTPQGDVVTFNVLAFGPARVTLDALGRVIVVGNNAIVQIRACQLPPTKQVQFYRHMLKVLDCTELCDVTFIVGEEREEIHAHRLILANRSEYFNAMLNSSFREGQAGAKIELPHVQPFVFSAILKYLYTTSLKIDEAHALEIARKASEYQLTDLFNECRRYCQENISSTNAISWLMKSDCYALDSLKPMFLQYVCQNMIKIKTDAPETIELLNGRLCREVIMRIDLL